MRYTIAISAVAVLMLAAQTSNPSTDAPPTPTRPTMIDAPRWKYLPGTQELSCFFPERALSVGRTSGEADLACTADARGWLSHCQIVKETPEKFGFGAAATVVATRLLVMDTVDVQGSPVAGRPVGVRVRFSFSDPGSCSRFLKNQHKSD